MIKFYQIYLCYVENKIFRFQIWDTYNQGVLVSRVHAKGEEFVSNRNDKILLFFNKI